MGALNAAAHAEAESSWAEAEALSAELASAKSKFDGGGFEEARRQWESLSGEAEQLSSIANAASEAEQVRRQVVMLLEQVAETHGSEMQSAVDAARSEFSKAESRYAAGEFVAATDNWTRAKERVELASMRHVRATQATHAKQGFEQALSRASSASTHPKIVATFNEAKSIAVAASSQFEAGKFAAATEAWTRAKERADSALASGRLAEQASAARAAFEKTNGELKPSADARLTEARTEARRQADSAATSFAKGDFDQAASAWSAAREKLSKLKDSEIDLGDGVSMRFVEIKPGRFMMGSPASEPNRDDYETQHEVTISKSFWLGQTEVTQAQWQAVMGSNPSYFKGNPNHPVETVSWNDAQEFCRRLSQKSGMTFRLPTEAEWEYACRAGTTTAYSFGNDASRLAEHAWFRDNSGDSTKPVATKKPNAWGLYDMHGNVWEWCADGLRGYSSRAVTDPQGPRSGTYRVLRGGSWYYDSLYCRAAYRYLDAPALRHHYFGFRVARTP